MEIKSVWVTTRAPSDHDQGQVECGHYFVEDGWLQMCSESGKPIGKRIEIKGVDPARIAGRLTREAWAKRTKESSFNRPLNYQHWGVA